MKAYVITIQHIEESQKAADRCIKSAAKFGIEVEKFFGITQKDNPKEIAEKESIPTDNFREKYSRFENCLSAFLSHYSLWKKCAEEKEEYLIFEHDAVVHNDIVNASFKGVLSYGAPSYGKFNIPPMMGVNKLVSKQYLPGAHCYKVKPNAAKVLVRDAKQRPAPTDLYLSNTNFAFVQEYYPWPVTADDSFTTIQNETGCLAKHNYKSGYEVI